MSSKPASIGRTSKRRDSFSGVPTLGFWLLAQGGLLAAGLLHVQITAKTEHSAADLAGRMMLIGQLIVSAAVFPDLLRSWRRAVLAAAIAFPFTQFAALAAHEPWTIGGLRYAALLLWLLGLGMWTAITRRAGGNANLWVTTAIVLWTLATPLLWYLNAEFSLSARLAPWLKASSPVLLAANNGLIALLLVMAGHAAAAGCALAALRFMPRRQAPVHDRNGDTGPAECGGADHPTGPQETRG